MSKFGSRFGRTRMVSVEDMENELADAATEVEELPGETTDAAVAEVTVTAEIVEDGVNEVEVAVSDTDTLEEVITVAENAEAEGGLDPAAAEMAAITVESIYARVGINRPAMVSMESFSSTKTRVKATQIAIEDWKQKLKDIWAAIVAALKKVVNFFADFFKNLFDAVGKIQSRANTLEKKAMSLKGEAKEKEIKAGSFAKVLSTAGSFDKAKAVASANVEVKSTTQKVNAMTKLIETGASGMIKTIAKQEDFDSFKNGFVTDGDSKDAPEGYSWRDLMTIFNFSIRGLQPAKEFKGKESFEAFSKLAVETKNNDDGKEFKVEKVPTLAPAEITKAAKNVQTVAKEIISNKASIAAAEKFLAGILAEADRAGKMATDDKGVDRSRVVSRAISGSTTTMTKVLVQVNSLCLRIAKATLDYAEISAKQYGGEEKAAA